MLGRCWARALAATRFAASATFSARARRRTELDQQQLADSDDALLIRPDPQQPLDQDRDLDSSQVRLLPLLLLSFSRVLAS